MPLSAGSRLGRYEIRSRLGAGGMGEVWLGHDPELGRPVAIKVLLGQEPATDESLRRFRAEARAASALNHPNIVTVHDTGLVDGSPFLVTEFVDGVTLRQRIAGGRLSVDDALGLAAQMLAALAAAGEAGIVHRDVKPENVMVRRDGWVKVLDFGLARRAPLPGGVGGDPDLATAPSTFAGTIRYMAPEQLRAQPLDARADLWSAATVLYELLAGEPPFRGASSGDLIVSILTREPRSLGDRTGERFPPAIEATLRRALSKDRESRHPSCRELLAEIEAVRRSLAPGGARRATRPDDDHPERTVVLLPDGTAWSEIASAISGSASTTSKLSLAPLPVPQTGLIARDDELAALSGLLLAEETRVVTLTGPGGTGKTRLALEAARRLADRFADGATFVPLDSLADPDRFPGALARALGIPEERLAEGLAPRRILIVLDNFEQLLGAAPVVSRLAESAPRCRWLVTSRERLRLAAEREIPVSPLGLPGGELRSDPRALAESAAVRLFLERARSVRPGVLLPDDQLATVASICERLDGLPLAIELAAARSRMLPPAAILERLDRSLALLTDGASDQPTRQRTMRGAIEWGHSLLTGPERTVFARLAPFAGGFSLEAAERVVAGPGDSLDVFELLSALVDRNLLRAEPSPDGEARFRMLGLIREFATERLAECPEESEVRLRHAGFFAELAASARPHLEAGAGQGRWLGRLERDHSNLLEALGRLLASGRPAESVVLAGDLGWFWYLRGHYTEGRRWLTNALAAAPDDAPGRAGALVAAGMLAFLQCDYSSASRLLVECRRRAEETGDQSHLATALQFEGSVARERGDLEGAIRRHRASLAIWREIGDRREEARSLNYIGFASWLMGNLIESRQASDETRRLFLELGDREGLAWALINLSAVAHYSGDVDRATELGKECLLLSKEMGYAEGIAWASNLIGIIALGQRRIDSAEEFLRKSLEGHRRLGDRWRMASILEALAAVASEREDWQRAARLGGAAEVVRESAGTPVPPIERPDRDRWLDRLRREGAGSVAEAWAEGRASGAAVRIG